MPSILDSLPALYRDLFPPFFSTPVPEETKATCAKCAMCEGSPHLRVDPVDGKSRQFRPDTKCCTYHPRLPNYLVGALLADARPELAEGQRRLREKLAARVAVTPQWVKPPPRYTLLYQTARGAFGRAHSLRCPYYDGESGGCTVWPYREAVCSTFFCRYVGGADGRKFYMSLKTYLTLAEFQLSRWALLQLHPDFLLAEKDKPEPAGQPLQVEDLDDTPPSPAAYRALWGTWEGREEALYRESHALVRSVTPEQFEKLLGLDGVVEQRVLESLHHEATAHALPRALRFNPDATVKWLPDGSVALGAYSEYDALALPGPAYELLVLFDGSPVSAVRERLRREKQADLDEEVLLELYRHRILVDAAA